MLYKPIITEVDNTQYCCKLHFHVITIYPIIFYDLFCSDFNSLSPHDVKGNCKIAFDAGDKLGIPRVIEPTDMHMLAG